MSRTQKPGKSGYYGVTEQRYGKYRYWVVGITLNVGSKQKHASFAGFYTKQVAALAADMMEHYLHGPASYRINGVKFKQLKQLEHMVDEIGLKSCKDLLLIIEALPKFQKKVDRMSTQLKGESNG